jgi:uncharacterized protein (DUF433 family)
MADVVRTEDVPGGEPRLDGTRIGVFDVYELVVEGEHAPADVADQLDLSLGEVYTALAYYHEHPEEMREVREQRDAIDSDLADRALAPPEPAS